MNLKSINFLYMIKLSVGFMIQKNFQGRLLFKQSSMVVQGGLVLDCICNVKYGIFFALARPFLDT